MSIENAVINILSSGNFDECPADARCWSNAKHSEFFKMMKRKGFFLISSGDFDTARETIEAELTERHREQINAKQAES